MVSKIRNVSPKGSSESSTEGGPIVFTYVLSPKGTLQSRAQWGPFDILSILLCLEKGVGTFKFSGGERPFLNLENVLSPGGTSACRL